MKKIKILRIIARLNIGGPAIHTILLTQGLDKDKFESVLVHGSLGIGEGDMSYYAQGRRIKPVYLPQLKREIGLANDLAAFFKILTIIFVEKPDIIHTHTAKAGALGRSAAIFYNTINFFINRRVKIVHTFHGHVLEGYFSRFKTKLFLLIERILAFFTVRIVTVSGLVKQELAELGIARLDKIEVIPLGFELDKFIAIPEKKSPSLNIGCVGRLVPIKNHRLFLQSAAIFIQSNPDCRVKFRIIGDGELRTSLEDYARELGIRDFVEFLGWQQELTAIYADLDIVCLTSLNEGTPVSVIEAMACAKPVVSTDVGGISDLLGSQGPSSVGVPEGVRLLERGIITRPDDPAGFAAGLSFLLSHRQEAAEMGKRGRVFAGEKFAKERLLKDIESLYLSLLAK